MDLLHLFRQFKTKARDSCDSSRTAYGDRGGSLRISKPWAQQSTHHIDSPGVQHSSTAKIAPQKVCKMRFHPGSPSLLNTTYFTSRFIGIISCQQRLVNSFPEIIASPLLRISKQKEPMVFCTMGSSASPYAVLRSSAGKNTEE